MGLCFYLSLLLPLVLLGMGFAALVAGSIIYFANLNRDVPDLDSPARYGWALILLSGLLTVVAVVLSLLLCRCC